MGKTGDSSRSRYLVDLDRSRSPRAFRGDENFWRADLQRIYRLVDRQLQLLDTRSKGREETEAARPDLPHLSIAIFGPSGSGKSSLLRTLHDDVQRPQGGVLRQEQRGRVFSMPVMDPTTWAKSDQFLYAFLAAALEEDRKEQDRSPHSYRQGLSPVQLAFQDVNEYLRVLDEIPAAEEHDPLGLSLQRLERHTSGLRLRESLVKFVDKLCRELGAEIILLPVDDLDMAPHHLVNSLQAYQSFLTHPRLIPIFTFTDRMPEELIEAHHDQRLGSRPAAGAPEGVEQRLSISQQLSLQFLARCFPVRNRIRLGPAPARVQRAFWLYRPDPRVDNETSSTDRGGSLSVLELLTVASFLLYGHPDEEAAHEVCAALRPSTLRRQLQVFDAMVDCRLRLFRTPQLMIMAWGKSKPPTEGFAKEIAKVAEAGEPEKWREFTPATAPRLNALWDARQDQFFNEGRGSFFEKFGQRLREERIGATWASVFNGAAWSLLNVHRDTLRELGLYLEDLYSWNPVELRNYVLANILSRDRVTRRTVVDRWFNRADSRRSQVLSLLAANIFRPWMEGEEPYGDDERAVRKWEELEETARSSGKHPIDHECDRLNLEDPKICARLRLMFPATEGLRWFLNVTLGFYLPLIMARDWRDALSTDEPVRVRMSGSGWDLHHAPINAVRIADAKREILSFGMHFLDPTGYRKALEGIGHEELRAEERAKVGPPSPRGRLLLRIWSCCGYSRGRYWAAISLWRGLGFIGRVLEKWAEHSDAVEAVLERGAKVWKQQQSQGTWNPRGQAANILQHLDSEQDEKDLFGQRKTLRDRREELAKDGDELTKEEKERLELLEAKLALRDVLRQIRGHIKRLINAHCLAGLVPGSLLGEGTDEEDLLQAFPRWRPERLDDEIDKLATALVDWLFQCREDRILPFPVGDIWIGWRDCFVRRIHGEYIMGSLWPHLHAAYLQEQKQEEAFRLLAERRTNGQEKVGSDERKAQVANGSKEEYRWSAAVAIGAWSDLVLEYWRGCPPILRLLLLCPVFLKSNERFGLFRTAEGDYEQDRWLKRLSVPEEIWEELKERMVGETREDAALVCNEFCVERPLIEKFSPHRVEQRRVELAPLKVRGEPTQEDGLEVKPLKTERKRAPSEKRTKAEPGNNKRGRAKGSGRGTSRARSAK